MAVEDSDGGCYIHPQPLAEEGKEEVPEKDEGKRKFRRKRRGRRNFQRKRRGREEVPKEESLD